MSLSQGGVCLSCLGPVDLGVLLPHLAGVIVEAVTPAAGLLLVTARARAPEGSVHEVRYRVAPGPQPLSPGRWPTPRWEGRPVAIALAVRRFFCAAPGCPAHDVRRASRRPDQPLRAQDPAAGRHAREHRGRAGGPGGIAAGRRPGRSREQAGPAAAGHGRPGPDRPRPRGSSGSTTRDPARPALRHAADRHRDRRAARPPRRPRRPAACGLADRAPGRLSVIT